LLSQWRACCQQGGVSLEFDAGRIEEAAQQSGFKACWRFYSRLEIHPCSSTSEMAAPQSESSGLPRRAPAADAARDRTVGSGR
jgi:hypothetical protein